VLKKAGAVAVAAAGLVMVGSPAFAHSWSDPDEYYPGASEFLPAMESEQYDQLGLVNFSDDSDVLSQVSALCNLDVNVLAVPVLQGNDSGPNLCVATDDDGQWEDEDDDEHEDDDDK
jgi:hypothetical protein